MNGIQYPHVWRAVSLAALAVLSFGVAPAAHGQTMTSLQRSSPQHTTTIRLYYIALSDNGKSGAKVGCGDSLVAVKRVVPATNAPLTAAFRMLLSDHHRFYGQSGLYNALYRSRLTVQRISVVSGRASIYLRGTTALGGVCDDPRFKGQLRSTALQFPTVRSVAISINGRPMNRVIGGKG